MLQAGVVNSVDFNRGYALFGGLSFFYGFLHISGLPGPVNLPAYILGLSSSMGMLLALGVVLRQILSSRPALSR